MCNAFLRGDFMRKIIAFILTFALLFGFSACRTKPEAENTDMLISSEAESSASEQEENSEPEVFSASLISNNELPESFIEPADGLSAPKGASEEEVGMTPECREIYDKYISPTGVTLSEEFSESEIPFRFLTHVYYVCERLDYDVLGIEKSGYDMAESYWINGDEVEERLCRWFPWTAEDIRNHFEYNSETGEYSLPGAGGGPHYSFVTGFEYPEDGILRIYISEYDGYLEEGPYPVMDSFVLEVRLNDDGSWTYISNKKAEDTVDPIWFNADTFCGADMEDWNYDGTSTYNIFSDGEASRITVYGSVAHKMYFDQKPCCFFISTNGIWVYGFDSLGLRHISSLPTEKESIHFVKNVWFDSEERIIIAHHREGGTIEIAVLDYATLEVVNWFDTGLSSDFSEDIPIGLQPETVTDGTTEIYDAETKTYKKIEYMT